MRSLAVLALVGSLLLLEGAAKPKSIRTSVAAMERSIDAQVSHLWNDPFLLLGTTRGIYVEGYGVVFTAEVSLATAPGVTPFHPLMSKDEMAAQRAKKLERLPRLRQALRDVLVSSAASLDTVPDGESIVLGVTLFRYSWEDPSMPSQIVLQGQKKALLAVQSKGAQVESAVRVEEF